VHFCEASGTWQTRQVFGAETIEIGCLGHYELNLNAVYQHVLSG
jgi:hypothetical protein